MNRLALSGLLAVMLASPAHAASDMIIVSGKINACYKFDNPIVFLQSATGKTPEVESGKVQPAPDGSFRLQLHTQQFPPGPYYLMFGTADGPGAERIDLRSSDLDLGTVGDCDL